MGYSVIILAQAFWPKKICRRIRVHHCASVLLAMKAPTLELGGETDTEAILAGVEVSDFLPQPQSERFSSRKVRNASIVVGIFFVAALASVGIFSFKQYPSNHALHVDDAVSFRGAPNPCGNSGQNCGWESM